MAPTAEEINLALFLFHDKDMEGSNRKKSSAQEEEGYYCSDEALVVSLEVATLLVPITTEKADTSVVRDITAGTEVTMDACFKSFDKDE